MKTAFTFACIALAVFATVAVKLRSGERIFPVKLTARQLEIINVELSKEDLICYSPFGWSTINGEHGVSCAVGPPMDGHHVSYDPKKPSDQIKMNLTGKKVITVGLGCWWSLEHVDKYHCAPKPEKWKRF